MKKKMNFNEWLNKNEGKYVEKFGLITILLSLLLCITFQIEPAGMPEWLGVIIVGILFLIGMIMYLFWDYILIKEKEKKATSH